MKSMLRELAWLFAYAAVSFVLTGALLGYQGVWPGGVVDIQVRFRAHYMLTWWLALQPLFLAAAVPLTLVRAAQAGYRQRATNVVLAGLALLTLLVVAALTFWVRGGPYLS